MLWLSGNPEIWKIVKLPKYKHIILGTYYMQT